MKWYDAPGVDRPLLLDEDYAAELGYKEHKPLVGAPTQRATKQEWIDYAISQGADPAVVRGLQKAELVEQYGSTDDGESSDVAGPPPDAHGDTAEVPPTSSEQISG